ETAPAHRDPRRRRRGHRQRFPGRAHALPLRNQIRHPPRHHCAQILPRSHGLRAGRQVRPTHARRGLRLPAQPLRGGKPGARPPARRGRGEAGVVQLAAFRRASVQARGEQFRAADVHPRLPGLAQEGPVRDQRAHGPESQDPAD
ncbi:hypothetical protein LTR53_019331, partial [Teratosphaeriaceae sp. CCFEE 6253]